MSVLAVDEIKEYVSEYRNIAKRAVEEVIAQIGVGKVAFRLSPWATPNGMKGAKSATHSVVTYGYTIHELQKKVNKARIEGKGAGIAYFSTIEPRVKVVEDVAVNAGNFEKNRDALVEKVKKK